MLRYVSQVLTAGLRGGAFIQITRVYGQALAQIAEQRCGGFTCMSTNR